MAGSKTRGKVGAARPDRIEAVRTGMRHAARGAAGLAIAAAGVAWVLGVGALESRVAASQADPIEVVFEWPRMRAGGETIRWPEPAVQHDLVQIVKAAVAMDPFDHASLVRAQHNLAATGWFTELRAVERRPEGIIAVEATWRVPAAVVHTDGAALLVGLDGAPMRTPPGSTTPAGFFEIRNPYAGPPMRDGRVACGHPWTGGDVQAAIELLHRLSRIHGAHQIVGIDLSEYLSRRDGKLVILTDTGSRIVWGSPLDELAVGEEPPATRIAVLEQNFRDFGRIDAGQRRIEIYTPVVLIDKTATRDR